MAIKFLSKSSELITDAKTGRLSLRDASYLAGGIVLSGLLAYDTVANGRELSYDKILAYGATVMIPSAFLKFVGARYGVTNSEIPGIQNSDSEVDSSGNSDSSVVLERTSSSKQVMSSRKTRKPKHRSF